MESGPQRRSSRKEIGSQLLQDWRKQTVKERPGGALGATEKEHRRVLHRGVDVGKDSGCGRKAKSSQQGWGQPSLDRVMGWGGLCVFDSVWRTVLGR